VARLEAGRPDGPAVGRLRSLLVEDRVRSRWRFADLFEVLAGRLSPEDLSFYELIGRVVRRSAPLTELEAIPRWMQEPAIDPNEPWPGESWD